MILRNQLLAALAAATCALAPAAFSQEPPSGSQDPADVGEPAPQDQQDLPPTTTDENEQTAPGAATEQATPGASDSTTAGPIDDKKIEQLANAYMAVQTIQQKAATELQGAKEPAAGDS